jgi:hypothetical protein
MTQFEQLCTRYVELMRLPRTAQNIYAMSNLEDEIRTSENEVRRKWGINEYPNPNHPCTITTSFAAHVVRDIAYADRAYRDSTPARISE